jgi:hypothetical protein
LLRVINLKLATPRIVHRVIGWKILREDRYMMLSDHEIIEWKYNSREEEVDKEHLVGGWSLAPLVGSMEEDMKRREVVPAD